MRSTLTIVLDPIGDLLVNGVQITTDIGADKDSRTQTRSSDEWVWQYEIRFFDISIHHPLRLEPILLHFSDVLFILFLILMTQLFNQFECRLLYSINLVI